MVEDKKDQKANGMSCWTWLLPVQKQETRTEVGWRLVLIWAVAPTEVQIPT